LTITRQATPGHYVLNTARHATPPAGKSCYLCGSHALGGKEEKSDHPEVAKVIAVSYVSEGKHALTDLRAHAIKVSAPIALRQSKAALKTTQKRYKGLIYKNYLQLSEKV
jgi:hypothetical protein